MKYLALAIAVGIVVFATPARSAPHEAKCVSGFVQYCLQYERGSPDAMYCMFRNVHQLSKPCVDALLAARLLTREQIQALEEYRLRKKFYTGGR